MGEPLWLANGRVRVHPILSGHPNQYLMFHLFKGSLKEDRKTPPTRVRLPGRHDVGLSGGLKVTRRFCTSARLCSDVSTGYPAGFSTDTFGRGPGGCGAHLDG